MTTRCFAFLLVVVMAVSAGCAPKAEVLTDASFLKAVGKDLRDERGKGKAVTLHGTNAGGYLLQELWMTPTLRTTRVKDETSIQSLLESRFGKDKARELEAAYRDSYWTARDFDSVRELGANCIRLPFWYRTFAEENGELRENAFARIDWFVSEAGKRGLYVILDMHGAPGSQNGSDHSGFDGERDKKTASGFFFGKDAERNQRLFLELWKAIATHYKGNPAVAGYDLLNEPFCAYRYNSGLADAELHSLLWGVYDAAYRTIRGVDPDHLIVMEAVWDPVDLPDPARYGWENVMYEYHNYLYGDYDNAQGKQIANMEKKIGLIAGADYAVPSLMGEFNYFANYDAWDKGLALLSKAGVHWTTWTYKTNAECGNWGIFHHAGKTGKIDLEHASFESIKNFWDAMDDVIPNANLISVLKKHM
jgi:endoglucanase